MVNNFSEGGFTATLNLLIYEYVSIFLIHMS